MFNGKKIKELLEKRGISQVTFCERTGVKKSNLYVWMDGQSRPGSEALEKIADFFELPIDYFFDRNIEIPSVNVGHQVKGNGNKVSGNIALRECEKEIEHLKALLEEKERTIQILLKSAD